MGGEFDSDEPSLPHEDVERRREPRGFIEGLVVSFPDGGRYAVIEASRKGFFVGVVDPETFSLGAAHEVSVERGDRQIDCRIEVVRKEIDPRRGVALRIAHISPVAEETLKTMIGTTDSDD